jgi:ACR3 family arsenite transporter
MLLDRLWTYSKNNDSQIHKSRFGETKPKREKERDAEGRELEARKMDTAERGPIGAEKDKDAHNRLRDGVNEATRDVEKSGDGVGGDMIGTLSTQKELPPLKGLSFLDRFLVVWIILAMAIGIALGNTVDSVGPALQRGEFVGVSIPIGTFNLVT